MNDEIDRDNILEVVIVVNGTLEMSSGKIAGQTFQAAWRTAQQSSRGHIEWLRQGTRTIAKEAKTQAIFDRIRSELDGYTMVDEGHTEVEPDTATVWVSKPFLHKDRPAILDNKRVRLL